MLNEKYADLCVSLREGYFTTDTGTSGWHANEAADIIEEQAEEIARLREALGWFLTDRRFVVTVGGNPDVVDRMLIDARNVLERREVS